MMPNFKACACRCGLKLFTPAMHTSNRWCIHNEHKGNNEAYNIMKECTVDIYYIHIILLHLYTHTDTTLEKGCSRWGLYNIIP